MKVNVIGDDCPEGHRLRGWRGDRPLGASDGLLGVQMETRAAFVGSIAHRQAA